MMGGMAAAFAEHAPPAPLVGLVACTWVRETVSAAETATVLPDGCMDLIVYADGTPYVAGPDTAPVHVPLTCGIAVGLRFNIGQAPALLGVPAAAVRDQRLPLEELWGGEAARLADAAAEADAAGRRALLLQAVARRRQAAAAPDLVVEAAVRSLSVGGCRVGELARRLGVSERQLLRRFDRTVGYGPKTLDRVLRARRLLRALRAGTDEDLALLALDLGYADQAHMTRDAGRLLGGTPAALRAAV